MLTELQGLQRWYLSQCDGKWEHGKGVTIGTLDNPGWSFRVDLDGTLLHKRPFAPVSRLEHPSGWLHCTRTDTQFEGAGGPLMLGELIGIFLAWAEQPAA